MARFRSGWLAVAAGRRECRAGRGRVGDRDGVEGRRARPSPGPRPCAGPASTTAPRSEPRGLTAAFCSWSDRLDREVVARALGRGAACAAGPRAGSSLPRPEELRVVGGARGRPCRTAATRSRRRAERRVAHRRGRARPSRRACSSPGHGPLRSRIRPRTTDRAAAIRPGCRDRGTSSSARYDLPVACPERQPTIGQGEDQAQRVRRARPADGRLDHEGASSVITASGRGSAAGRRGLAAAAAARRSENARSRPTTSPLTSSDEPP